MSLITIHNAPVGTGTTAVVTAIAVPVMVTIDKSKISKKGSIEKVTISDIMPGRPSRFTTALKNTGNIHYYQTNNSITIFNSTGKEIAKAATGPSIFAIIPTYKVNYEVNVDTPLSPVRPRRYLVSIFRTMELFLIPRIPASKYPANYVHGYGSKRKTYSKEQRNPCGIRQKGNRRIPYRYLSFLILMSR